MGPLLYGANHRCKNVCNTGIFVKRFASFSFLHFSFPLLLDTDEPYTLLQQSWSQQSSIVAAKATDGCCKPLPPVRPSHRAVPWVARGPWSETHGGSLRNSSTQGPPCTVSTALLRGKHEQHPIATCLCCRKQHCWIERCSKRTET